MFKCYADHHSMQERYSCSPGVKNLGDVAMQSGTSVRNAQEKFMSNC